MMTDQSFDQPITFKQALHQPITTYELAMDHLLETLFVRLDVRPAQLSNLELRLSQASKAAVKRGFDLAVALTALIALAPLLVVLSVLIRTRLGSPIIFRQERPGLHGKPFTLFKFRTMTDARNAQGDLLPDEQRMTAFGQFLRSSSLDELPELWNVVMGNMSLVGTRPLLMEYLALYTPEQARRLTVKPGITGWAQINGRNNVTWEKRFALDVWYVENQSFGLDVKILFQTFATVVKREGISQQDHVTMPRFTGTQTLSESAR